MLQKSLQRLLSPSVFCLRYHPFVRYFKLLTYQASIIAQFKKRLPNDDFQKKKFSPVLTTFPLWYHKNGPSAIVGRENIWTIPNILCVSRIAVTPYLGYLILSSDFFHAVYIMMLAGITDMLDGLIARTWYSQSSKLGSFLDPMADKILIITVFSTMTYSDLIPAVLTVIIIARDISLVSAAFYIRYLSLPPPRTLARYFDVSHATAQLAPTQISKFNTVVQLATIALTLTASAFSFNDHPILPCLWYFTGTTTVASAASYLFSKNTYRILKRRSSKKH